MLKILLLIILFMFLFGANNFLIGYFDKSVEKVLDNCLDKYLKNNENKITYSFSSKEVKLFISFIFSCSLFLIILSFLYNLPNNMLLILFLIFFNVSVLYIIFIFLNLHRVLILTNCRLIEAYIDNNDIKILKNYDICDINEAEYDFFIKPCIVVKMHKNEKMYITGYSNCKNIVKYINKNLKVNNS